MQPFIPAKELKQKYGVFGHFYSVELASKEVIDCRSVLEIASHAHSPEDHSELSGLRPDAVFVMMNPGSSSPLVEVNNRIRARAIHKLPISLVPNQGSVSMSNKPLTQLVRIYRRKHGSRLAAYLDYFQQLDSLDDAIRYACHGKEGRIHGHQHLVGKAKLEQARKKLQKSATDIDACESFDDLLTLVENRTSSIYRFGVLAVYDTALRLGAHLDLWPEVVYLHAGTKKGCKALGVATKGSTVEMEQLPKPIRSLEPYQAEDFLCIFKDQFEGEDGEAKGCLPRGC